MLLKYLLKVLNKERETFPNHKTQYNQSENLYHLRPLSKEYSDLPSIIQNYKNKKAVVVEHLAEQKETMRRSRLSSKCGP